jgi:hypothetical protein
MSVSVIRLAWRSEATGLAVLATQDRRAERADSHRATIRALFLSLPLSSFSSLPLPFFCLFPFCSLSLCCVATEKQRTTAQGSSSRPAIRRRLPPRRNTETQQQKHARLCASDGAQGGHDGVPCCRRRRLCHCCVSDFLWRCGCSSGVSGTAAQHGRHARTMEKHEHGSAREAVQQDPHREPRRGTCIAGLAGLPLCRLPRSDPTRPLSALSFIDACSGAFLFVCFIACLRACRLPAV